MIDNSFSSSSNKIDFVTVVELYDDMRNLQKTIPIDKYHDNLMNENLISQYPFIRVKQQPIH